MAHLLTGAPAGGAQLSPKQILMQSRETTAREFISGPSSRLRILKERHQNLESFGEYYFLLYVNTKKFASELFFFLKSLLIMYRIISIVRPIWNFDLIYLSPCIPLENCRNMETTRIKHFGVIGIWWFSTTIGPGSNE